MFDLKKATQIEICPTCKSGSLCKDHRTLIKSNKNQLRDKITFNPAARLAGLNMQQNFSTMTTREAEESGLCGQVAFSGGSTVPE